MRRTIGAVCGVGLAFAAVLWASGCGGPSCEDVGNCGTSPDGGDGASGETSLVDHHQMADVHGDHAESDVRADAQDAGHDTGPSCTPDAPPSMNGCITATSGVFVSTGGSDTTGNGSMTMPYATISHALANLGTSTAVYVCNGPYMDQITVSAGLSLYGGLTCKGGDWQYVAKSFSTITGTAPSFALEVDAGSATVDVEDLQFVGANASAASGSSIAVWVNATPGVTLQRVHGTGGTAVAGTAGSNGSASPNYAGTAPNGTNASGVTPGPAVTNVCTDTSESIGGGGGNGGTLASGGNPGQVAESTPIPAGNTGAGGILLDSCGTGGTGLNGSDGPGGTAGMGALTSGVYVLAASAWQPSAGTAGQNGTAAQGGGGGTGATHVAAGGGGGGGAGGCGGTAGGLGTGGGASIGLLLVNSAITLTSSVFTGGTAGNGGVGGNGEAGQSPGLAGVPSSPGCEGGGGGYGGGGGGGGGGAGGLSVGVAYVGSTPPSYGGDSTLSGSSTVAAAGGGGTGGIGDTSSGAAASQGANGGTGLIGKSVGLLQLPSD
jgi:hypothetical protein